MELRIFKTGTRTGKMDPGARKWKLEDRKIDTGASKWDLKWRDRAMEDAKI